MPQCVSEMVQVSNFYLQRGAAKILNKALLKFGRKPNMNILFQSLQITRSDVRPHIKWDVSLVIAYGHFNLPQGFVWVCMGKHTHFI